MNIQTSFQLDRLNIKIFVLNRVDVSVMGAFACQRWRQFRVLHFMLILRNPGVLVESIIKQFLPEI